MTGKLGLANNVASFCMTDINTNSGNSVASRVTAESEIEVTNGLTTQHQIGGAKDAAAAKLL